MNTHRLVVVSILAAVVILAAVQLVDISYVVEATEKFSSTARR